MRIALIETKIEWNEGVQGHLILEIRLHGLESLFNALPSSCSQNASQTSSTDEPRYHESRQPWRQPSFVPRTSRLWTPSGVRSYWKSRSCPCVLLRNTLSRVLSTQDLSQRAIQSLEGSINLSWPRFTSIGDFHTKCRLH